MALLDFLKNKKEDSAGKVDEKKEKKEVKQKKETPAVKKEAKTPADFESPQKGSYEAHRVLFSPHITEKATDLSASDKYVFKVWPKSNKIEIKKAIESIYGVDVEKVNIVKIPRKRRRVGRTMGWTKGYKKAIISVKKGQKIEILPK